MNTRLKALELLIKQKELGITEDEITKMEDYLLKKEPVRDLKAEEILSPESELDKMTDEELLYYATPYYEELQIKKENMKKIKESELQK